MITGMSILPFYFAEKRTHFIKNIKPKKENFVNQH
jgi:hypothetical protein